MKYDYYLHKSKGVVGDYFSEIGYPVKVNRAKYYAYKLDSARATKVPEGSSLTTVMTKALIDDGTNLESQAAKESLKSVEGK